MVLKAKLGAGDVDSPLHFRALLTRDDDTGEPRANLFSCERSTPVGILARDDDASDPRANPRCRDP